MFAEAIPSYKDSSYTSELSGRDRAVGGQFAASEPVGDSVSLVSASLCALKRPISTLLQLVSLLGAECVGWVEGTNDDGVLEVLLIRFNLRAVGCLGGKEDRLLEALEAPGEPTDGTVVSSGSEDGRRRSQGCAILPAATQRNECASKWK